MYATREYTAFGPWIDQVDTVEDLPRLYRGSGIDPASCRLVLKVPRDIERRNATPDMHLYDHLLVVGPDLLTVLSRRDEWYETIRVPFDQIVAIENSTDLLDGRLVVHTGLGRRITVGYNAGARDQITKLISLLRELYLPAGGRAEPSVAQAAPQPGVAGSESSVAGSGAGLAAAEPGATSPDADGGALSDLAAPWSGAVGSWSQPSMAWGQPAAGAFGAPTPSAGTAAPCSGAVTPVAGAVTPVAGTPFVGAPAVGGAAPWQTQPAACAEPASPWIGPLLGPDDQRLLTAYETTLRDEPGMRLFGWAPRQTVRPIMAGLGPIDRVRAMLWPVTLHASIVLADEREVQILHRRSWFTRGNAPALSLATTVLPRAGISGIQIGQHDRHYGVYQVSVQAGQTCLRFPAPAIPEVDAVLSGLAGTSVGAVVGYAEY